MEPNAFVGRREPPSDAELSAALGSARDVWDRLVSRLAKDCGIIEREWGSPGPKYGWSLRLIVKKRRILYLVPRAGGFGAMFVLGSKAIAAAKESRLPVKIARLVETGQRYPEGTAVRIESVAGGDLPAIVKLASIKIRN